MLKTNKFKNGDIVSAKLISGEEIVAKLGEETEKQKAIEELIKQQREFMENVNKSGYTDEEYWLKQGEYRDRQVELSKLIQTEAHKKYWDEYRTKLKVDIGDINKDD